MRSGPGPRALNAVIGAPRANVGVLRAAFRGPRWSQTGHATTGPAGVAGHCESANLSQRVAINLLHSQCERFSGTVRVGESVPVAHSESVREGLGMRSHIVAFQTRRPIVQPEPRSSRGDRGFAFLASCRRDARPRRSWTRSPREEWRVDARVGGRPIALSGPVLGGDWGERGRGAFNRNGDPFYRRRENTNTSPSESAARRRALLLANLGHRC